MKKPMAKRLAMILTGGLLLGTGCLPNNYWVDLVGTVTTQVVTAAVDLVVIEALAEDLTE